MSGRTKKVTQRRYTPDQIISLLDKFDRSNITLKAFCTDHGISEATAYNWRKRYLDRKVSNSSNFIELLPATPEVEIPDSTGRIFAEVRGISIYQPVSAAYLKALIS